MSEPGRTTAASLGSSITRLVFRQNLGVFKEPLIRWGFLYFIEEAPYRRLTSV